MSKAVTIYLDAAVEHGLRQLATDTERSMSFYVRELIKHGLEDVEDYYRAAMVSARIRSGKEKVYSMEEVEKNLGLTH